MSIDLTLRLVVSSGVKCGDAFKKAISIEKLSIKSDQLGAKAVEATRTYLQRYDHGTPSQVDVAPCKVTGRWGWWSRVAWSAPMKTAISSRKPSRESD